MEESNVVVEWLALLLLLLCVCGWFSQAGCLGRICVLFVSVFNQTLA
jgi:hypothetical protein